jgi:hypothetical protein
MYKDIKDVESRLNELNELNKDYDACEWCYGPLIGNVTCAGCSVCREREILSNAYYNSESINEINTQIEEYSISPY